MLVVASTSHCLCISELVNCLFCCFCCAKSTQARSLHLPPLSTLFLLILFSLLLDSHTQYSKYIAATHTCTNAHVRRSESFQFQNEISSSPRPTAGSCIKFEYFRKYILWICWFAFAKSFLSFGICLCEQVVRFKIYNVRIQQ